MSIFDVSLCEELIGYTFKDKMLLRKCFTHSSYAHENGEQDNELLEFFGDAIIQFVVTEYLVKNCKGDEGDLTKKRIDLVSKAPLLRAVKELKIHDKILLGNGLNLTSSHQEKLYSSLYEALVAGIYLDGGIQSAKAFVKRTLIDKILVKDNVKTKQKNTFSSEWKNILQEHVQKYKLGSISYETLSKTGPDHSPLYREAVLLSGTFIAEGTGRTKKIAQAKAAEKAIKIIK